MTAFVDENRDEFGVEPVLRRGAELPRLPITSTNGGCGNRSVARPAAGGIANFVSGFAVFGSPISGCTAPARCGVSCIVKEWR